MFSAHITNIFMVLYQLGLYGDPLRIPKVEYKHSESKFIVQSTNITEWEKKEKSIYLWQIILEKRNFINIYKSKQNNNNNKYFS